MSFFREAGYAVRGQMPASPTSFLRTAVAVVTAAILAGCCRLGAAEGDACSTVFTALTNAQQVLSLGISESMVKKHMEHILEKLAVESRGAAGLRAIETLNRPAAMPKAGPLS